MDAKIAIALSKNFMHHKRSKHIDIKYHWLREHMYENETVKLYRRNGYRYDDQSYGI